MTRHALNVFLAFAVTCFLMLFAIGFIALIELARRDASVFFVVAAFALVFVGCFYALTMARRNGGES